jgi:hypothetical protein
MTEITKTGKSASGSPADPVGQSGTCRILCLRRSGRQGVLCTGDLERVVPAILARSASFAWSLPHQQIPHKTDTRYERGWRGRRVGETGVTFSGEFGRALAGTSSGVADSGRWSAAGRGSPPPPRSPGRPPIVLVSRSGSSRSRSVNRPATTRFVVQPRRIDELTHPRTVGIHHTDVPVAVSVGAEGQSRAVWRPKVG